MRAERLAWAETQDVSTDPTAETEHARPKKLRRSRLFHRNTVRQIARGTDAIALGLVTVGLCLSAGIDLMSTPFAVALPYVLMPVLGVAGVWVAGGYRFRFAEPIISHLAHVALGISLVMGAIFVIALMSGSSHISLYAKLGAANAPTISRLSVRRRARGGFRTTW